MDDVEVTTSGQNEENNSKPTETGTDPGIIYLSRIPKFMSVKVMRNMLEIYGELGRLFLQPDEKAPADKKNRIFTEGWVEFQDKRIAKRVAFSLNNTQIGGKRRSPWYHEMWNIKYLPKFKWGHLNERLAYERAVHKQRLRTEVAQVKRETNFYKQNVEKNAVLKKLRKQHEKKGTELKQRPWLFKQNETEEEYLSKKQASTDSKTATDNEPPNKKQKVGKTFKSTDKRKAGLNVSFLQRMFSGGVDKEKLKTESDVSPADD